MTYRDPAPTMPDCPVCDSPDRVQAHDNPHQGRFLATCCMVLFDGTSAEWVRPEREAGDISEGLAAARAALRGDEEDAGA